MGIVRTTNLKFFFFPLLLAKAQFSLGIDEWQEFTIHIYIWYCKTGTTCFEADIKFHDGEA